MYPLCISSTSSVYPCIVVLHHKPNYTPKARLYTMFYSQYHIRCISVVYPLFIRCISVVYHVLHHKPNSTPGLAHDFDAGFAAALALLRFFSKLTVKQEIFVTMYVCMLMYNTYIYIYNYSFVFWYTYIQLLTYIDKCINNFKKINKYINTYVRTYVRTYMHACMHPSIHPSIHTYIHPLHAYMHTCIHTCRKGQRPKID